MNNPLLSIQLIVQQQLLGFLQKKNKHFNIYYQIIVSTLLASFTTKIFNKTEVLYEQYINVWLYIKRLLFYKKINMISLISKKIWTRYGRYKNVISEEKLGILYFKLILILL